MEHITIITVGGTIDKRYPSGHNVRTMEVDRPFAPHFITRKSGAHISVHNKELMRKDGIDMTPKDRAALVVACWHTNSDKVIITHGTDNIILSAQALAERDGLAMRKTVVLTGSLQPACVRGSDAEFNLGLAVAACLTLPPGIFIAIGGIFDWDKCTKRADGTFAPL